MSAKKSIGFATGRISKIFPDYVFIKLMHRHITGKRLNLRNPKTFNEKLQWMKLHYRNPLYTKLVDKYEVREYVAKTVGEKYLIPLLGVYDSAGDIDFDSLPEQFVLKCNHDSGSVIICKDKKSFDIEKAKEKLAASLKINFYYLSREWPYKNIKPRIICEKYMAGDDGEEIKDYKIFCFDGEPKLIQVDHCRFSNHKRNLYDTDWNFLNIETHYPNDPDMKIEKPEKLDEMLFVASSLSKDLPHARVDLYLKNGGIYFGEITFCHQGGNAYFIPEEFNYEMGSWLVLPAKNK